MRYSWFLVLLILFSSCVEKSDRKEKVPIPPSSEITSNPPSEVIHAEFQPILDSLQVKGAILILDVQERGYYSNDFAWTREGRLPASTFKIPNSLIALETGVVEDDSALFPWDGEKRAMGIWEKDMVFSQALKLSCVPCYQDIARRVGLKRMREYLAKFDYGKMVLDSNSLDMFWLEGDSRISQMQQIDFLQRFYNSDLPISDRTEKIMKKMLIFDADASYRLSGKTGWAMRKGIDNGWFVGYIETKGKVFFFATNVEPKAGLEMNDFARSRIDATYQALKVLEILD